MQLSPGSKTSVLEKYHRPYLVPVYWEGYRSGTTASMLEIPAQWESIHSLSTSAFSCPGDPNPSDSKASDQYSCSPCLANYPSATLAFLFLKHLKLIPTSLINLYFHECFSPVLHNLLLSFRVSLNTPSSRRLFWTPSLFWTIFSCPTATK